MLLICPQQALAGKTSDGLRNVVSDLTSLTNRVTGTHVYALLIDHRCGLIPLIICVSI
jgi:hypothetical protein